MQYPFVFFRVLLLLWLVLCGSAWAGPSATLMDRHLKPGFTVETAAHNEKRTPLILIHGIAPNRKSLYSWRLFLESARQNSDFQARYQVWLFVYDPTQSVSFNSGVLRRTLQALSDREKPDAPFRLAALSLGGLIVRQAMAEDAVFAARVDRVITLGSPFHGTPLASPPWFRERLRQESPASAMRWLNRPLYWLTGLKFPHFSRDFGWDDYNAAVPDELKPALHRPQYSVLPPEDAAKFITYAGFFHASPAQLDEIGAYIQSLQPEKPAGKDSRVHWGGGHHRMKAMHKRLSDLPLKGCQESPSLLMHLNDGLSPVASQLWLGRRTTPADSPCQGPDRQWLALRELNDQRQGRLFYGLDHRDWLEGRTRFRGNTILSDWLHTTESPRPLFDWLMHDLTRG